MTKPPREPGEVEKIKEGILEKALEIIVDSGPGSLTMRKIADLAGMSATNLYNYFTNKEEIYLSILVKGYRTLHGELEKVVSANDDPLQLARELVWSYLSFGFSNSHYYDIMFSRPAPRYDDYVGTPLEDLARVERELTQGIIDVAKNAISKVLSARGGAETAVDSGLIIVHIWCLMHGMVVLYNNRIVDYITEDPKDAYERLMEELFRLLMGP